MTQKLASRSEGGLKHVAVYHQFRCFFTKKKTPINFVIHELKSTSERRQQ